MAPANQVSLVSPLLVGIATILCTIVIHGFMLALVISTVRRDLLRGRVGVSFIRDLTFVTAVTLLAFIVHLIEIGTWAVTLDLCGEFSAFSAAFYHSAVDYTTLGDSVVISSQWRLLGPLSAADGTLMFGVSTAMIFAVVQRLIQSRFVDRESGSASPSRFN
jgi:hypothetical protein